jgi:hypothetical protein
MNNKKETTLEELAEKYSEELLQAKTIQPHEKSWIKAMFIWVAKFQAQRMYSDIELFTEELKDKIDSFEYSVNQNSYISDYIKKWLNDYKQHYEQ